MKHHILTCLKQYSLSFLILFTILFNTGLISNVTGQEITFNPERGFYNSAFQVTLTSTLSGATIRYTTNGTAPTTTTGTIYSGPVTINKTSNIRAIAYNSATTSKVITHTYIFLDEVIQQPKNIAGWPNNTYNTGQGSAVHDYEMDPAIVNAPAYNSSIKPGLLSIPTMSIVMDKDQFWQSYNAPTENDIENPASVEVIYPDDPSKSEHANCGLEGHSHNRLKRSLRLKFKSAYGDSKFNTQLLRKGPVNGSTVGTSLDNLVLRAGNNRSWARTWNPDRTCYTRDEWYRQSQVEASGFGSHGSFVHLYVNGLYWGLYNPIERPDTKFSALYFGGSDSDWYAVNHDGSKDGDSTRFRYLLDVLIKKDLSIPANYDELKLYLNINDFCDYMIVTWMTGMTDWPANNFWGGNRNNPPGPFHYYGWDCEWSWDVTNGSNEGAWVHPNFRKNQTTGAPIASIWNAAKKNPDFLSAFADRVNKQCYNNGPLTDANSRKRWTDLNNFIQTAIIAESARWGDALNDSITRTKNDYWQPEVTRVDNLMNGNVTRFINALRTEGYYPSLDAPLFSSSGGEVNKGFQLTVSNPNSGGTIYYTINGADPKNPDGNPSPSSSVYSGPITINNTATIKARIKNGTSWSATTEGLFTIEGTTLIAFDLSTGNYLLSGWSESSPAESYPPNMQFVRAGTGIQDPVLSEPMEDLYSNVYNATSQSRINGLNDSGFSFINTGTSGNLGAALLALKTSGRGNIRAEFIAGTIIPNVRVYGIRLQYKIGNDSWKDVPGPIEYLRNDTAGHTANFNVNLSLLTSQEVDDQELIFLRWKYYFISGTSGARAQLRIDDIRISSDVLNTGPVLAPFDLATGNYSLTQWDPANPAGTYPSNMLFKQGGETIQDPVLSEPMEDNYIKAYNATSQSRINGLGNDGFSFINTGTSGNLGAAVLALKTETRKDIIVSWSAGTVTPNVRIYAIRLQYKIGNSGTWTDIPGPVEYVRNDTAGHMKSFSTNISAATSNVVNDKALVFLRWKYYFVSGASSARAQLRVDDITVSSSPINAIPPHGVLSLTLVNADTDQDIRSLKSSDTINLAIIPGAKINIRANTNPAVTGSVVFLLNNSKTTENTAPYSLKGDNNGNYNLWTPALGLYTLSATPYTASGGNGNAGTPLSIQFRVINQTGNQLPVANAGTDQTIVLPVNSITLNGSGMDPDGTISAYLWTKLSGPQVTMENTAQPTLALSNMTEGIYTFRLTVTDNNNATAFDDVTVNVNPANTGHAVLSFTLINADTDQDIRTLKSNDTINLSTISGAINIRANTNPTITGSVVFNLNNSKTTESSAPYSLKGDNNGNYNSWTPALGFYTLSATPFVSSGGNGSSGTPLTIQFRVINQTGNQPPVANAGPDRSISLPTNSITLNGSGSDPDGTISTYLWTKISGPQVTVGNATQPDLSLSNMSEGAYIFRLTVTDNNNASAYDETTVTVTGSGSICQAQGSILREYWTGVSGESVSTIPLHITPSGSEQISIFEGPQNWADRYGTRIRGYVCPPQTGDYYFWIASNDGGELWLSTDENPANKIKIAFVNTYTNFRDWTKFSTQKSTIIHLEAGKKYYIEALHKEGVNSDHISVGWQLPDGVLERPIPGSRLSPFTDIQAREAAEEPITLFAEVAEDTSYQVLVFPNPAEQGTITVGIIGYKGKTKADIRIMDMNGKEIYSDKAACDKTCARTLINIDERFQAGTYLINVTIENKLYHQKLIIK